MVYKNRIRVSYVYDENYDERYEGCEKDYDECGVEDYDECGVEDYVEDYDEFY